MNWGKKCEKKKEIGREMREVMGIIANFALWIIKF